MRLGWFPYQRAQQRVLLVAQIVAQHVAAIALAELRQFLDILCPSQPISPSARRQRALLAGGLAMYSVGLEAGLALLCPTAAPPGGTILP
eukprot:COSAG06_NODE_9509_length_1884_cov_1.072269_2_plen_90_part_00